MGQAGTARCQACDHQFELWRGGGFQAQIVFCEDCGKGESLPHFGKPLSEDADESGGVGQCSRCSGRLNLNASARCPRCRSPRLEMGEMDLMWD